MCLLSVWATAPDAWLTSPYKGLTKTFVTTAVKQLRRSRLARKSRRSRSKRSALTLQPMSLCLVRQSWSASYAFAVPFCALENCRDSLRDAKPDRTGTVAIRSAGQSPLRRRTCQQRQRRVPIGAGPGMSPSKARRKMNKEVAVQRQNQN